MKVGRIRKKEEDRRVLYKLCLLELKIIAHQILATVPWVPSHLISLSITKGREMKEGKEIGASFIFK